MVESPEPRIVMEHEHACMLHFVAFVSFLLVLFLTEVMLYIML